MSDVSLVHNYLVSCPDEDGHLPCDKGMPGGKRSFHRFQIAVGADRAVCVFCGTTGPSVDTYVQT